MRILKEIKVFSLCGDFGEDELYESLSEEATCDSYIEYTVNSSKWYSKNNYNEDPIGMRLIELGCVENEKVLIHIDY